MNEAQAQAPQNTLKEAAEKAADWMAKRLAQREPEAPVTVAIDQYIRLAKQAEQATALQAEVETLREQLAALAAMELYVATPDGRKERLIIKP